GAIYGDDSVGSDSSRLPAMLADDPRLELELDAEPLGDAPSHRLDQPLDVLGCRAAGVHDEVRVLLGNLRAADREALQSRALDQRARVRSEEHTSELQS